jgi:competence protein ComEC
MVDSNKKTPAEAAALGAAAAYYAYPFLFSRAGDSSYGGYSSPAGKVLLFTVLFGFILLISLCRVLSLRAPAFAARAGLFLTAAALGFSLGLAARQQVSGPVKTGLPENRITGITGRLSEDPRAFNDQRGVGSVELSGVSGPGGLRVSAEGKIPVFFPAGAVLPLKEFGRGCEFYAEGTMVRWKGDLLFRAASVHVVKPASPLEQFRTGLRSRMLVQFDGKIWGPLASALLLGVRDNLDADLSEAFRNAGCSHVLALSGMHLALLSGLIAFVLRRILGLRAASVIGGLFIAVYVYLAGAQPSLMRSAVMYFLGTFALLNFFKNRVLSALSLAFIIQIIIQGESGTSLSFILSYLALAGILWIGEDIHALLRGKLPGFIAGSLSASLGAFIATAAVVSFYFGVLRPVGIFASLFIVPLASLFMILALVALGVSFIAPPLFGPASFLLDLLYRALEFSVSITGKVPGLEVPHPAPALILSLAAAALILLLKRLDQYRKRFVPFN